MLLLTVNTKLKAITMTAYRMMKLEDLMQRQQIRGEVLSEKDQRELNTLWAEHVETQENTPSSRCFGGDFADVF